MCRGQQGFCPRPVETEKIQLWFARRAFGLRIERTKDLGYARSESGTDLAVDHSNQCIVPTRTLHACATGIIHTSKVAQEDENILFLLKQGFPTSSTNQTHQVCSISESGILQTGRSGTHPGTAGHPIVNAATLATT